MKLAATSGQQVFDAALAVPSRHDLADSIGKATIVSLFTWMAVRLGVDFPETGRLTGLLLLASEALVVVLTMFRRAPIFVDRSIRARVLTTVSLVASLTVSPAGIAALAPGLLTVGVSAAGLVVVIAGKLSLGRSFGLMPANRGVVSTGLYRIVRHPIYLGYIVTHVAFLAENPSPWNIAVLVSGDIALMARAICEEATLARDARYREYQARVRWRIIPGVF